MLSIDGGLPFNETRIKEKVDDVLNFVSRLAQIVVSQVGQAWSRPGTREASRPHLLQGNPFYCCHAQSSSWNPKSLFLKYSFQIPIEDLRRDAGMTYNERNFDELYSLAPIVSVLSLLLVRVTPSSTPFP